jgi:hypothetical protein
MLTPKVFAIGLAVASMALGATLGTLDSRQCVRGDCLEESVNDGSVSSPRTFS